MAKTTPSGVEAFGQTPSSAHGHPALPNSFSQRPGSASVGKAPSPSAEGSERGSTGKGVPSGVKKMSGTENMQSQKQKGPMEPAAISTGEKSALPSGVDDFNEVP